jgi:MFS family permease
LTPVIADWNLIALIISRVILGMAQSVDFPAGYLLLTKWFPERELGTALGLFTAGSNIGN